MASSKEAIAGAQFSSNGEINLSVVCRNCGAGFQATSKDGVAGAVHHKERYEVKGQSIFLTYCDCPECGSRHYVQIDSVDTLEKLKSVQRQYVKLAVAKRKGKTLPKSQTAKFKKARQNLITLRNALVEQYTGAVLVDKETGVESELRFSL